MTPSYMPQMPCERCAALAAENERLKAIEKEAEDIMTKANLKADHYAYDLMRTVLRAGGHDL